MMDLIQEIAASSLRDYHAIVEAEFQLALEANRADGDERPYPEVAADEGSGVVTVEGDRHSTFRLCGRDMLIFPTAEAWASDPLAYDKFTRLYSTIERPEGVR